MEVSGKLHAGRTSVRTEQKAVWASGLVWAFRRRKNLVSLPGVEPQVLHSPVTCLLGPNIFRCTLLHDTLALCSDFLHHTKFHTHTATVLYIVILEFSGSKGEGIGELVKVNQSH